MSNDKLYLFVDTETTGLNFSQRGKINKNTLLEIAYILTDTDLNIIQKGEYIVGYEPNQIMYQMNDYVKNMHETNGLLNEVYNSKLTKRDVDELVYDEIINTSILKDNVESYKIIIAGNTVHFDKEIIRRDLPKLYSLLHFRNFDVSSVREMVESTGLETVTIKATDKKYNHRAMDDIEETINELKQYKALLK